MSPPDQQRESAGTPRILYPAEGTTFPKCCGPHFLLFEGLLTHVNNSKYHGSVLPDSELYIDGIINYTSCSVSSGFLAQSHARESCPGFDVGTFLVRKLISTDTQTSFTDFHICAFCLMNSRKKYNDSSTDIIKALINELVEKTVLRK